MAFPYRYSQDSGPAEVNKTLGAQSKLTILYYYKTIATYDCGAAIESNAGGCGIGAGPGGLAPLKVLLEHVPADSGLALVIVAQVPADQGAPLADLLQPHARFPVEEASQATPIEPNRAYIIPADADLMAIQTHLRWTPLEERRRERAPIDHLLRMLAGTYDGHTIAVILTGNGSDGTLGIQDVKANGGVIIVQDPPRLNTAGCRRARSRPAWWIWCCRWWRFLNGFCAMCVRGLACVSRQRPRWSPG